MIKTLTVAGKEFRDHITTRRFLVIFAILAIMSMYGMAMGISSYNELLEQYKNPESFGQSWRWEAVDTITKTIQDAEASHASQEEINALQEQRDLLANPVLPSIISVFKNTTLLFTVIGAILGVSMGFDVVTRETEDGTLKTILSSPLYRDTLLIGKAIGALATLTIALGTTFLLIIAIMIVFGIVPSGEDITRITVYFIASILYCSVFFTIAMMASAIAKNSTLAILYTIGIVFILFIASLLSPMISDLIVQVVIGPAPTQSHDVEPLTTNESVNALTLSSQPTISPENSKFFEEEQSYSRKKEQIQDVLTTISPIDDFCGSISMGNGGIANAILSKEKYEMHNYLIGILPYTQRVPLLDSIAAVWYKILALLIEVLVAFAISYVVFIRTDIR